MTLPPVTFVDVPKLKSLNGVRYLTCQNSITRPVFRAWTLSPSLSLSMFSAFSPVQCPVTMRSTPVASTLSAKAMTYSSLLLKRWNPPIIARIRRPGYACIASLIMTSAPACEQLLNTTIPSSSSKMRLCSCRKSSGMNLIRLCLRYIFSARPVFSRPGVVCPSRQMPSSICVLTSARIMRSSCLFSIPRGIPAYFILRPYLS